MPQGLRASKSERFWLGVKPCGRPDRASPTASCFYRFLSPQNASTFHRRHTQRERTLALRPLCRGLHHGDCLSRGLGNVCDFWIKAITLGEALSGSPPVGAFCKTPGNRSTALVEPFGANGGRFAKRPYWLRSVPARFTQNKGKTEKNRTALILYHHKVSRVFNGFSLAVGEAAVY